MVKLRYKSQTGNLRSRNDYKRRTRIYYKEQRQHASTDASSRSCACSRKLGSKFRDLHLVVSVRDWSVMFARDGEE